MASEWLEAQLPASREQSCKITTQIAAVLMEKLFITSALGY